MKKNSTILNQNFVFKVFKPLNIKYRFHKKLLFFMKYFFYSFSLQKIFLNKKVLFLFISNFFSHILYFNWSKLFSQKYCILYFENPAFYQLKLPPKFSSVKSINWTIQKTFFLKKYLKYSLNFFLLREGYLKLIVHQIVMFWVQIFYKFFIKNFYNLFIKTNLLLCLKNKI